MDLWGFRVCVESLVGVESLLVYVESVVVFVWSMWPLSRNMTKAEIEVEVSVEFDICV